MDNKSVGASSFWWYATVVVFTNVRNSPVPYCARHAPCGAFEIYVPSYLHTGNTHEWQGLANSGLELCLGIVVQNFAISTNIAPIEYQREGVG